MYYNNNVQCSKKHDSLHELTSVIRNVLYLNISLSKETSPNLQNTFYFIKIKKNTKQPKFESNPKSEERIMYKKKEYCQTIIFVIAFQHQLIKAKYN